MIKHTKTKLKAKVRVGEDIRKIHDKDNTHNTGRLPNNYEEEIQPNRKMGNTYKQRNHKINTTGHY